MSRRSLRVLGAQLALAALLIATPGVATAVVTPGQVARVTGVVVDGKGVPVPVVDIEWTSSAQGGYYNLAATTGPSGRFTLTDVDAGATVTIEFVDNRYGVLRTVKRTLSGSAALKPGETRNLGRITMTHAQRTARSTSAIRTSGKASVRRAYKKQLRPTLRSERRTSTRGCKPGSTRVAVQKRTIRAVNYYRAMSGLDPVTRDAALSKHAQRAALISHRARQLNHYPAKSAKCWSASGARGAQNSNLAQGMTAGRAVQGYMNDWGVSNFPVGHRRWILAPGTRTMGTGDVGRFNALYVVGARSQAASTPEWLPWPSAGYFPAQEEPDRRWSLSSTRTDTSFRAAKVSVRTGGGKSLKAATYPSLDGYGYQNTLVWQLGKLPKVTKRKVTTLVVTVRNIEQRGVTLAPYSYTVRLFRA